MSNWPIQRSDVEGHLGVAPAGELDAAAMTACAEAAAAWVAEHVNPPLVDARPSAAIVLGTVLLAARWYGRRSSPSGVASFGEFGPAYVKSRDPDVAMLLGLGRPSVA